ncbi:DUF1905 domain-containing protein [Cellulomonas sp. PhB150]|uniref:DUF1905 domain-containing protein n=1 Tax=Cellulomonas sp. PhB150 TaxID=2485188 RepID=UPI000F49C62F|nr:DUF1905 domain-containing protein [Cellulomonas sp. PhB150]ROS27908.1 uncharacterized protein DUF1905 [Cellulomonas sp. PhB150]
MEFEFEARLRLWDARRDEGWTFADVPPAMADEILEVAEGVARGFGSVRVQVRIGGSTWRTSLFPGESTYALPIKKAVRTAEGCEAGDTVQVWLELVDVPRP